MEIRKTEISTEALAEFCRHWKIREIAFFGSVLRDDFGPGSDIDILITPEEDARLTLFDLAKMKMELEQLSGREVDLVTKRGIEASRNRIRSNNILNSAKVMYAAR